MVLYTSVRKAAPQLSLIAVMVFFSMYSRVVLSPLLVFIQDDLAIGPAVATRFFLPLSLGYSLTMLTSGFLAERIGHRRTIAASAAILGIGLLVVAVGREVSMMYLGFGLVGGGAGLYPPSGVTSLTAMVHDDIRGSAIAIHELGPNSAFVAAPLVVSGLIAFGSWRLVPLVSGIAAILMAVVFNTWSRAGGFRPARPDYHNMAGILKQPVFWAITVFFSAAASSTMGVFAILPTFLIGTEGYPVTLVNTLLSASRISGLAMVFLSGYLVDRIGVRRLIGIVLAVTGVLTVGIGALTGHVMLVMVFLQPVVITAFFPPALSAIADLGPPETRGIAVSLVIPTVNVFASGVFPMLMGFLTERGLVRSGFIGLGVVMLVSLVLLPMVPRRSGPG